MSAEEEKILVSPQRRAAAKPTIPDVHVPPFQIGIALGSSSASVSFKLSGPNRREPQIVKNWPEAPSDRHKSVPVQLRRSKGLLDGDRGDFTWGYQIKAHEECERLLVPKATSALGSTAASRILLELYGKKGRNTYQYSCSPEESPSNSQDQECLVTFLTAVKAHVAQQLANAFRNADGATSGLREEYCIVIPPWLGTTWPQLRSILRRCDLRPRQLITEPEACLAFYLNGRNPAVIKKGDSLLSCQMEEEMTTFAHYTVTQISQAAKKGPGSTRSATTLEMKPNGTCDILAQGCVEIGERFVAIAKGRLRLFLQGTELGAETVYDGFTTCLPRFDGERPYSVRLPWSVPDDLELGIRHSNLEISGSVIRSDVFNPILASLVDTIAGFKTGKQRTLLLLSGILSECPYIRVNFLSGLANKDLDLEILSVNDGTASSKGATLLLDHGPRIPRVGLDCDNAGGLSVAISDSNSSLLEGMATNRGRVEGRMTNLLQVDGHPRFRSLVLEYELLILDAIRRQGLNRAATEMYRSIYSFFRAVKSSNDADRIYKQFQYLYERKMEEYGQRMPQFTGAKATHFAAYEGDLNAIRLLVQAGSLIDEPLGATSGTLTGYTPLHLATQGGHTAVVSWLLEQGADFQAETPTGCTLLHLVLYAPNLDQASSIASLILGLGDGIDDLLLRKDRRGVTALDLARRKGAQRILELMESHAPREERIRRLFAAASNGDVSLVRTLLKGDRSLATETQEGSKTALHVAAIKGHSALIRPLLESGAGVDAIDSNGRSPLHWASTSGYLEVVRLLLEGSADFSLKDAEYGRTALHWAADYQREHIVRLLLQRGANVKAMCHNGSTALHYAVKEGAKEAVKLLLRKGASIEASGAESLRALHIAAASGQEDMVRLLLKKGADANAKTKWGTALHPAAAGGRDKMVDQLLYYGADANAQNNWRGTPLHNAARGGHTSTITRLLEGGALTEAKNQSGRTALHVAAEHDMDAAAALLLQRGADANATDDQGLTALDIAVEKGHRVTVSILLSYGATVTARDASSQTILDRAAKNQDLDLVTSLFEKGAEQLGINRSWTVLHWAAATAAERLVRLAVTASGDSVHARDSTSQTPLHLAASNGHVGVVRVLLENHADITVRDKFKWTPLHKAALHGHYATMGLLLDKGADVLAKTGAGASVMRLAVHSGSNPSLRLLRGKLASVAASRGDDGTELLTAVSKGRLQGVRDAIGRGVDIDRIYTPGTETETALDIVASMGLDDIYRISTPGRETALHIAASMGLDDIASVLLDEGASADLPDRSVRKHTALHRAAERGHTKTVTLLLFEGANPNAVDRTHRTALHIAAEYSTTGDTAAAVITRTLLAYGALVNTRSNIGLTPLLTAVRGGGAETVRALLEDSSVDLHLSDSNGWTPLWWAVSLADPDVLKQLLAASAAPRGGTDASAVLNTLDPSGRTFLHHVVSDGSRQRGELLVLLYKYGADPAARSANGKSAMDVAVEKEDRVAGRVLMDLGVTGPEGWAAEPVGKMGFWKMGGGEKERGGGLVRRKSKLWKDLFKISYPP